MMYPIISKFLTINRPSVALIILSWLAFNFKSIFLSYPVTINELSLFFLSILVLEVIFYFTPNKKISLFILLNTILFLFGYLITLNFQILFNNLFDIFLRGRMIFLPLFLTLNISLLLVKKIPNYNFINIFLFIFITVNISNNLFVKLNEPKKVSFFENKKIVFPAESKNKAILLLILDEYHSPDDLYRVTKDSSIYNLSSNLNKNGWQINNSFYSQEISTVASLSSIFNYNLSYDTNFKNVGEDINDELFLKNLLFSDLLNKDITMKNWGIFDFGSTKPLNKNNTPKKLTRITTRFIQNTTINLIWGNTNKFSINGFKKSYYPGSKHNIHLNNNLNSSLIKNNPNSFTYAHLLMPHTPFYYPKYFSYKKNSLKNYILYWKFTNSLLVNKLLEIANSNSIKIIITGDHGFRSDARLNKNKTFLALYGFETLNINEIKTVQDIGSLINSNF
jgi:hypothetical protein